MPRSLLSWMRGRLFWVEVEAFTIADCRFTIAASSAKATTAEGFTTADSRLPLPHSFTIL
jgi:hypothetical protein